jgi:metal-dependent amidase/aminoacylase/carboxypeptidase family protein
MAQLQLWGDAAHPTPCDLAAHVEAVGVVATPGPAVELLPTVPGDIVDDQVQVDLAAAAITEDEPRRQAGQDGRVVREPESAEEVTRGARIAARDYQIDVVVLARLLAEQRVDPPAAVESTVERRQRLEHFENVVGGEAQTTSAGAGSSNSAGAVSEYAITSRRIVSRSRSGSQPIAARILSIAGER